MIGSDVSVILDQKNFGLSQESDPRFVSNDIFISKNKTTLSKGVFTVCKKKEGKCPAWSLKAKKISHDKIKKTIFYEHATLKLYDIPIFYFPYRRKKIVLYLILKHVCFNDIPISVTKN